MERQTGLALVALLFLANFLTTEAASETDGLSPQLKVTATTLDVEEKTIWTAKCEGAPKKNAPEWTKNDEIIEITNGGEISDHYSPNTGWTLEINGVLPKHGGDYRCSVNSNISNAVTLIVREKNNTVTTNVESEKINPNFRIFVPHLKLNCNNTSGANGIWTKDNNNETWIKSKPELFKLHDNKTLEILTTVNAENDTLGVYTCTINTKQTNITVALALTAELPEMISVVEGEKLQLECEVTPKEADVEVIWQFGNNNYTVSNRSAKVNISNVKDGKSGHFFTVDNVAMDDKGFVSCFVKYRELSDSPSNIFEAKTDVRVKDKFAALWPFLGICVEVVVLCSIILIYEKKRNKTELDESDTDQSPDTKPVPNKDSEVRQRK